MFWVEVTSGDNKTLASQSPLYYKLEDSLEIPGPVNTPHSCPRLCVCLLMLLMTHIKQARINSQKPYQCDIGGWSNPAARTKQNHAVKQAAASIGSGRIGVQ